MKYNIYFSPTGGTKHIVQITGECFEIHDEIDISLEISDLKMTKDDFCIVGVPSFGGRVPAIAVQRLRQIQGEKTPVLLIVTYGNRAYEDTLIELKDVLEMQGFVCVGAMAVVTKHSIVPIYGKDRPTANDIQEIKDFTKVIQKRLKTQYQSIEVPGNRPYKEFHTIPIQPKANQDCSHCGLCAKCCPVQAIPINNPKLTNKEQCISCMRCVKICPNQARKCNSLKLIAVEQKLKKACSENKKNEFF